MYVDGYFIINYNILVFTVLNKFLIKYRVFITNFINSRFAIAIEYLAPMILNAFTLN